MKRQLLLFILIFLSKLLPAQNYYPSGQVWTEVDFIEKLSKKFVLQNDIQYSRQGNIGNDVNLMRYNQQLTLRSWLHYYPIPKIRISFFAGLWYNYYIPQLNRQFPEYRTALQGTYYKVMPKSTLAYRFRVENRNIQDAEGKFENVFRFRTQLKYVKPLNATEIKKGTHYLVGFDEVFINAGSTVTGHHLFDQNRIFIGYGYAFSDYLTFETGYFNQFQIAAHSDNFYVNHIWQISFYVNNVFGQFTRNTTPDTD